MAVHRRRRPDSPSRRTSRAPGCRSTGRGTLDAALRLQPHTREVLVVGGTSSRDEIRGGERASQLAPYQSRGGDPLPACLDAGADARTVAGLPDRRHRAGQHVPPDSAGEDFASRDVIARDRPSESRVPVYGVLDSLIGTGVVGAHMLSSRPRRREGAGCALRVLAGDRPGPPSARQHRSHLRLVAAAALGSRRASAARRQRAPLPPAVSLGGVPPGASSRSC